MVETAMKIKVWVRDDSYDIFCGAGTQKIRWLSDVALHRYEHFHSGDAGLAKGMRYENGTLIDMEMTICEKLENNASVFVILKEDLALMESEVRQANQD